MRSVATTVVALLLLLTPTLAAPLAAQAPSPFHGNWSIEWEIGRSIMNGETTSIKAKGTMTIASSGDSLVATVTTVSRGDGTPPRAPVTLGGRLLPLARSFGNARKRS